MRDKPAPHREAAVDSLYIVTGNSDPFSSTSCIVGVFYILYCNFQQDSSDDIHTSQLSAILNNRPIYTHHVNKRRDQLEC